MSESRSIRDEFRLKMAKKLQKHLIEDGVDAGLYHWAEIVYEQKLKFYESAIERIENE